MLELYIFSEASYRYLHSLRYQLFFNKMADRILFDSHNHVRNAQAHANSRQAQYHKTHNN